MGYPSSVQKGSRSVSAAPPSIDRSVSGPARIAAIRKRESFRPRPSLDAFGMGGMPNLGRAAAGGRTVADVKEEFEDDL